MESLRIPVFLSLWISSLAQDKFTRSTDSGDYITIGTASAKLQFEALESEFSDDSGQAGYVIELKYIYVALFSAIVLIIATLIYAYMTKNGQPEQSPNGTTAKKTNLIRALEYHSENKARERVMFNELEAISSVDLASLRPSFRGPDSAGSNDFTVYHSGNPSHNDTERPISVNYNRSVSKGKSGARSKRSDRAHSQKDNLSILSQSERRSLKEDGNRSKKSDRTHLSVKESTGLSKKGSAGASIRAFWSLLVPGGQPKKGLSSPGPSSHKSIHEIIPMIVATPPEEEKKMMERRVEKAQRSLAASAVKAQVVQHFLAIPRSKSRGTTEQPRKSFNDAQSFHTAVGNIGNDHTTSSPELALLPRDVDARLSGPTVVNIEEEVPPILVVPQVVLISSKHLVADNHPSESPEKSPKNMESEV